jgi:hypothetical protein
MKKSNIILVTMLSAAVIAFGFGIFVLDSRTQNYPVPGNQEMESENSEEQENPEPEQIVISSTSGWKTYDNEKHQFTLKYPANLTAGSISDNSVLGTFDAPVRGFHVGPLVLVVLKDATLKKDAQDLFNNLYETASNPKVVDGEAVPPIECHTQNVTNTNVVSIRSVSCDGEGGPARYAYIGGKSYDVFVDGYSKGYDNANHGEFASTSDYGTLLSTFVFTADTPTSTTPPPSSVTPTSSPIQAFTIAADDAGANPTEITVNKDSIVQMTFNIGQDVYYGGLDFRSTEVNTGTINAGQSKTISFKATNSFFFTPYWPASQIAKNYTIKVTVQ